MAQITNYGELQDVVKTWLNRTDTTVINAIPMCISFAEEDFQRTFRLWKDEKTYTQTATNLSPDTIGKIILPQDYYELKKLIINNQVYDRESLDIFTQMDHSSGMGATGKTVSEEGSKFVFTRIGNEIHTIPSIVDGDNILMIYWKNTNHMTNNSDTSEALKIAPEVILYLTLRHASIYLRDNEQAQYWEQKAQESGSRLAIRLDEIDWSGTDSRRDYLPSESRSKHYRYL